MGKIEKIVKSLLTETKHTLKAICEEQNVEIIKMNIEADGLCLTCFNSKFIIINNRLTELSEDFIIGHELGHINLHDTDLIYLKENTFFSKDKLENEANLFSISILSTLNKNYEIESEKDLEIKEQINKLNINFRGGFYE